MEGFSGVRSNKSLVKVSVAVRQKFHGFQLAQQLALHKKLQTLYTSFYGSFLGKSNSIGYQIESNLVKTNFLSAIRTYVFNDNSFKSDDQFGRWVASQLQNEDIVVTWGLQALPIINKARQRGIKTVLERGSAHVIEQRDILLPEYGCYNVDTTALEKSFSSERIERELEEYEMADIISIPSSFVKRSFLKHGISEKKLFVNAFGADIKHFEYKPVKHDSFRIIYAGALSIRKGVHYLLQAFNELALNQSELWLVGKLEEEIKPFLIKYASPNIKLVPPVAQHELSNLYNQCDVFTICSIEEGMAMVQAQAMACGLPLICTTNTGGDDLIEDQKEGFVVPVKDVKELKERIVYLFKNKNDRINMSKNAVDKIKSSFTWSDYGNRAIKKYEEMIRK
ncbi:MAG: glycosyltransferase family 4 protein [Agriterribacter sp.]